MSFDAPFFYSWGEGLELFIDSRRSTGAGQTSLKHTKVCHN